MDIGICLYPIVRDKFNTYYINLREVIIMKDNRETNSSLGENISKWLSFNGRINKQDFWLYHVLPFVLLNLLPIPFSSLFSIWVLLAGIVKRFHDSNVSGKVLMPYGILWLVVVVLSVVFVFFFFLGTMSGGNSQNEFYDQLVIFIIPFMIFLLLPIYAGLKPSSPGENKYGPQPGASTLSKRNKTMIGVGAVLVIIVSLWMRGGISFNNQEPPREPEHIEVIENE